MTRPATGADERTPLLRADGTGSVPSGTLSSEANGNGPLLDGNGEPMDDAAIAQAALEAAKEALPFWSLAPSLASLFAVLFLAALDGTLVITLLSPIASSFDAAELTPWLATSYLLSSCIFTGLYGRLSNYLGRKVALLTALGLFTIGTLLCALSPSIYALLGARFVAGIGGGGLLTCCSVILTDLLPTHKRGVYQGWTQIIFSIGNAIGGPVGGALADWLSWRAAFGVQIPLLVLAFTLIVFCLEVPQVHLPPSTSSDHGAAPPARGLAWFRQLLSNLDLPGVTLLFTFLLGLIVSLEQLSSSNLSHGVARALLKPWVAGPAVACVASAVLFLVWEANCQKPLLELRLLRSNLTIGCATAFYFTHSCAFIGLILHFPIFFEAVKLMGPSETGLHLLPMTFTTSLGSLSAGYWIRARGRYWSALVFGAVMSLSSYAYMSGWNEQTSDMGGYLALVPGGFGGAACYNILLIAVLSQVEKKDQALINGAVYLFRSLGSVIGSSVFGSVFQAILASELSERLLDSGLGDEGLIESIRRNALLIPQLPVEQRTAAIASYAAALRAVFAGCLILGVVCLALVFGVEDKDVKAEAEALKKGPQNGAPNGTSQQQRRDEGASTETP